MDNKNLAGILTAIGALGTIFGMVDPIKSLFPEPEIFYGLDTNEEVFDHSITPNQIKFHLIHNGTDAFYIDTINIRTKEFHNIECQNYLPDIPSAKMFDELIIPLSGIDDRRDNFVTINGDPNLNMLYEEGKSGQIVIGYDTVGPYENESFAFWQDIVVGYSEIDEREVKYARYHAHTKENPVMCR